MISAGSTASLSVLTYNLHLFGGTALYQYKGSLQETGFYYRDEERLPQIISGLRRTEADVIGLTEVWDDDMRREIESGLGDLYPYRAASPAAAGIGRELTHFIQAWPRLGDVLFGNRGGVVNYFTRNHYSFGSCGWLASLKSYFSEDSFVRGLSRFVQSLPVWGAGLLLLSRHPIVDHAFHPHEERADWEHLAGKGVIDATVRTDDGFNVGIQLGHFQEGLSDTARAVRLSQIRKARERTPLGAGPVLHLGDFNVPDGTDEYAAMENILGLNDARSDFTYLEPNPYQDKLQAPRSKDAQSQRIDYIFHSDDLVLRSAEVLRGLFRSDDNEYDLSDHFAVLAKFFYRPEFQKSSAVRSAARPPMLAPQLMPAW